MSLTAIAALLGASLLLLLPTLPSLWVLICAIFFLSVGYYFYRHRVLLFFLIAVVSFSYAVWVAQDRLAWQLPTTIENKPVLIEGMVSSVPEQDSQHIALLFTLNHLNDQSTQAIKVRLSWYDTSINLHPGDVWRLRVKLKRIHRFANPGGFDYEEYALENNIKATGEVLTSSQNQRLATQWYHHSLDRLRQKLAQNIHAALGDTPYTPMITALVVGEKYGIQADQWQVLQRTGTNHLLVIAGLHIGMLSGVLYFITHFLWRRQRRLVLFMPAQDASAIVAMIVAFSYAALAGFSIPTLRALAMMLVFMLAFLWRRNLMLGSGLVLALGMILILNPLATLSVAFWLSFAAVGFILYGFAARLKPGGWWWKYGKIQWVVSLGVIPFTLLIFQNASFISPLANSIVIPLVGFIVVPFSLLASAVSLVSLKMAIPLFHVAVYVLTIVWKILSFFANCHWLSWQHAVTSPIVFLSLLMGFLLLLAPRGLPARWLAIVYFLTGILYRPPSPALNTAVFTLLDVGQGLASVVQTAHHVLIFDTGAKFAEFDMGASVVVPFLQQKGINRIDMLVVSHGDNDHIGGAATILNTFPVGQIITSVPERFKPRIADYCLSHLQWQWDGVGFEFLYPDKQHLGLDNNSSCVLRITAGDQHLLLTGDIETLAETDLLNESTAQLSANIIVAPHHGSKTSSSADFVQAVKPLWVLFPVGYLNRYHFPSSSVVARYQTMGAQQMRSDLDGAISLVLGTGSPINPVSYRQTYRRFWRSILK